MTDPQRLAVISEQVADLKGDVAALDKRLFGNGQPGEIQLIKADVDGLKKDRNRMMGMIAVLIIIVNMITGSGIISIKSLVEFLGKR